MANILNLPHKILWALLFFMISLAFLDVSGSGIKLSPDSDMSYEEELRLFEAEEKHADTEKHLSRQKRFIYLNVDTNMAVALLIGIPLTFVLPSMTNLFSSWRRKRSIDDSSMNSWTLHDNSPTKPEMDKVDTYFQLLNIPEPSCQLRAVCEFSADPNKFYPLSDVILKRVRNPRLPALVYLESQPNSNSSLLREGNKDHTSLFDMYNQAADFGQIHGYDKCVEHFQSSCHYPIEKLLNMPVIRFWSALQSLLKLSFKDVAFK